MKINSQKVVLNGEAISHKIISVDKCCDGFVDSIRYGYFDLYENEYNKDTENYKMCYIKTNVDYDSWDNYNRINYCPFCSKKIELAYEVEDVTDKIVNLTNELTKLDIKVNTTDSISERDKLYNQFDQLNKQRSKYYNDDSIKTWVNNQISDNLY